MLKKLLLIFGLFLVLFSSVNSSLNSNLVSYYDMESVTDNTGNGHTLINYGATTILGKIGNAYNFNGINNYIDSYPAIQSNTGSISVWFFSKSNLFSGVISNTLIGVSDYIRISTYTQYQFITADSVNNYGTNNLNVWTHMVLTWDNGISKVYENGNLVLTFPYSSSPANPYITKIGVIGNGNYNWGNYFNGLIDEVGIWNRTLLPMEITQLYNNGLGITYPFNPINLVINSPLSNTNFTYDVPTTNFNVTTDILTTCSYTYNNLTTLFNNVNTLNHNTIFNLPQGINSSQTFNIQINCNDNTYSQTQNLTLYKQQVPLALEILVPQQNQLFNIDTSQIEFYLETNYVTNCEYKRDTNNTYTPFTQSSNWIHKTNFSTDLNISRYNLNFKCIGIYINENVSRNITFFLKDLTHYGITMTTQYLPQVGTDLGFFMENISPSIAEFILNFGILIMIISVLTGIGIMIRRYIL